MCWQKVALIGVGLLGGSLGMALRDRSLAKQVHGYVRNPAHIPKCVRAKAVDEASTDLRSCVTGADLVVLCTPLAQMRSLSADFLDFVSPGCLVTDVGSVKGEVVRDLEPLFASKSAFFVGSHPMAGSEKAGVEAARPDLFEKAVCVVTPSLRTSTAMVEKTEELWRAVGARILRLSPEVHDELVARSSHLPHVLAANLARYVLGPERPPAQAAVCATGFRDTTRIASGSPEMWRDIVIMNKAPLKEAIREMTTYLKDFEALLDQGDPHALQDFYANAKRLRDAWFEKFDSASTE
jgi:prephenate dehydrogenase